MIQHLRSPLKNCKTLKFTAGADITVNTPGSGSNVFDPFFQASNQLAGFVLENVLNGADGVLIYATDSQGYLVPKATGAIALGAAVYWDPDGTRVAVTGQTNPGAGTTTDDATHTFIGYAVEAAASGDANVRVQLDVQPPAKTV